jgi:hypothetical protein
MRKKPAHRPGISQLRHIRQGDRLARQQANGHQLNGRILRPANPNVSAERKSAFYDYFIHMRRMTCGRGAIKAEVRLFSDDLRQALFDWPLYGGANWPGAAQRAALRASS